MRSLKEEYGIVAILDALGASNYSNEEIEQFIKSRERIKEALKNKTARICEEHHKEQVHTYTFNDTFLITLSTGTTYPSALDIQCFLFLMRELFFNSLQSNILFRGSISVGKFLENPESNTVMGDAVTDAANWYDKPDWIGIIATPQASLILEKEMNNITNDSWTGLLFEYDVPLKEGNTKRLKTVNWPKGFFVFHDRYNCDPRGKLIELLSKHNIPLGAEDKYFNAISFFDHVVHDQHLS